MILSASRRTDIPAFYSDWFYNRIQEGFVDVRNPMNIHQVSRVNIHPDVVDCIVFWTKNATSMMSRIEEIKDYKYYFQYTINPYNQIIEPNVPRKREIFNNFNALASMLGPKRMIWRYDPILLTGEIDIKYHVKYFEEILKAIEGSTHRCIISFVDLYKKTVTNTKGLGLREPSQAEMLILAQELSSIANQHSIAIQSCSETIGLDQFGIEHGHCIDRYLVEDIIGYKIDVKKDSNQREECGCVSSIDIGAYNTCIHACKYCYANFNNAKVLDQHSKHDPNSSLLIGSILPEDVIKPRKVASLKSSTLFDDFD